MAPPVRQKLPICRAAPPVEPSSGGGADSGVPESADVYAGCEGKTDICWTGAVRNCAAYFSETGFCEVAYDDAGEEACEVLVDVEPGVMAKPEANLAGLLPEVRACFQKVLQVYRKYGYADPETDPLVITSGNDSEEHVDNSYHYKNRAIDVRGKYVPDKTLIRIAVELQKVLGDGFRVWAELYSTSLWYKDHIHIEYRGESDA